MMAIQTGIFGAQSVPGFEALNTHLGNRNIGEDDIYSGTSEAFGNEVSEYLMFGMASNFMRPLTGDGIDLYSRGNLNPRSPTIIPNSLDDVVVVNMATKAVKSMLTAFENMGNGVPMADTFYQALATNGVNRPLQGIGQILAGQRTTNQGTFMLSLQDATWWQTAARMAGSRGLDEAIAVSHYYRSVAYESKRRDKLDNLGRGVKMHINSGTWDGQQYSNFFSEYVSMGGDAENFDRWAAGNFERATQSQIHQMHQMHNSPQGRYLQKVMGADVEAYINPFNVPE